MTAPSRCLVATAAIAAAVALGVSSAPGGAANEPRGTVIAAHALNATRTASAPPTMRMALEFFLGPRDPAALRDFVGAVSTPGSASYRHYLGRGEFAARFGAAGSALATVRTYLVHHGMTGVSPSPDRLFVRATGTAKVVQRLLHTRIVQYVLHGRRVYANATPAVVPGAISRSVRTVVGLSSVPRAHPRLTRTPSARRLAVASSCNDMHLGTNPTSGPFTIPEIGTAYGYGAFSAAGITGQGQTVAVYELTDYLPSDVAYYQGCMGKQDVISPVKVDGGGGIDLDAEVEAALDVEIVATLAPKATLKVYEGPNNAVGPIDTYQRIATDDAAQVVTTSWGFCETADAPAIAAESAIFAEMATQGQTIVAASGDLGASDCLDVHATFTDPLKGAIGVDDPASQPYVTAIGGTRIADAGQIGSSGSAEVVWDDTYSGGGGGVSSAWPQPGYQSGVPGASTSGRTVPDLSIDADPRSGYMIWTAATGWIPIGGTSAGSPMIAALVALANEYQGSALGFLNPMLYSVGVSHPGELFNDVTSGTNETWDIPGYSSAAVGYDAASGWGSPVAAAFMGGDV